MLRLDLAEVAAAAAHAWWAGETSALGEVIDRTRAARAHDAVLWRAPLTPATVHRMQSLWTLAAREGARVQWHPTAPLHPALQAFHDDFLDHGPGRGRTGWIGRARELAAGSHEAIDALLRMRPVGAPIGAPDAMEHAVLIGAYGGDHVGDAAILGGVLLGLHARHGLRRASVMSHRPAHTQRLVEGLRLPVRVAVLDYRPGAVDRLLDDAQALVLAGGPLMDLPRVLAKHLAAAFAARARGVPLLVEAIGLGPFKRRGSRLAAHRILRMAAHISVRSSADARDAALAGLHGEVRSDPAFDYLATRTRLDALTPRSVAAIDRLLEGTAGRRLVALNLRPIRHLWSTRGAAYSRSSEAQFMDRLATALRMHAARSPVPVTYVFFPMNAIQFGLSDLAAAAQLHADVRSDVDLRVWEDDPAVDDVLHLLRRMDLAITMRFHAAIFARSQGVPVLGIDYYPGVGGKVEQLFADAGEAGNACRLDTFTPEWLVERAAALTGASHTLARSKS